MFGALFNDYSFHNIFKYLKDIPFVNFTKCLKSPFDSQ
jgi:hypothetical protein